MDNLISLNNLVMDYGNVRALDHLSLDVPAGTIFGFLGPNGAGKTTTIRLLLGLLKPGTGSVEVLGYDTHTQADQMRAHTGALLEHNGIYEQMSAEDNLEFYGRVFRMPEPERAARIRELLTHLGLWERRKDRAGSWSRGMKQKLALARTLLHRPSLVLLDEPTAGLDVKSSVAIRQDLEMMAAREEVTIFLTTHNMAEAESLCDKVAVIRAGKLVAQGHPDQLRSQAGAGRVEIAGRGITREAVDQIRAHPQVASVEAANGQLIVDLLEEADTSGLVSLLVRAGAQVEEVRRSKASLEEVFLMLTGEQDD